ncbi:hypothetical protein [Agarivorans sp. Z349TD_8]|uniref:hypothetical protein n=1 Tax=Agarivorans sp. Z349TD_8 TaxID=3421434 RepID=UPI003D7CE87A
MHLSPAKLLMISQLSFNNITCWANNQLKLSQSQALNQQREQQFEQALQQQRLRLQQTRQRLAQAEATQQLLKQQFVNNEHAMSLSQQQLQQSSGQLGKVFELIKAKATENQIALDKSLVAAEYPDASKRLDFAKRQGLPTAAEIQQFPRVLLAQLQYSASISFFDTDMIDSDGQVQRQHLLRIGSFNIINQQGQYLEWQAALKNYSSIPANPSNKPTGNND